jgi:hypothetical protein
LELLTAFKEVNSQSMLILTVLAGFAVTVTAQTVAMNRRSRFISIAILASASSVVMPVLGIVLSMLFNLVLIRGVSNENQVAYVIAINKLQRYLVVTSELVFITAVLILVGIIFLVIEYSAKVSIVLVVILILSVYVMNISLDDLQWISLFPGSR